MSKVLQRSLLGLLAAALLGISMVSAQDAKTPGQALTGPADPSIPTGGTVVVNESPVAAWIRNFNPFAPNPVNGTTRFVYEPLLVFNPVEGGLATPWLALSADYSKDLLTLTVKLRENVLWSDGQPFSADDVVFTFDLMKKFPALDRQGVNPIFDTITKVDANTVDFKLTSVYTQADTVLGKQRIVPEHTWKDVADPVSFTNDNPVTTGPFSEVKDFSDQVFTICKNPHYWQTGKPYVDCLQYPAFSGNDPANLAMINGELDWAGNFVPDIEKVYVAKDPEHFHYYFAGNSPWGFYVNAKKKPFDDVKVRQAISQAIDYEAIRDTAENGYTNVEQNNAVGIWPQWKDQVSQDVQDKIKAMGLGVYNPDLAKQTLEDAGYKVGSDGFRNMPDGTPIGKFNIQIVNGWTDVVTAAQIISQNLQDVGLNANVVTPDYGQWIDNLQKGTFDTSLAWSVWSRTPWDFFDNILNTTRIDANGVATGQFMPRLGDAATDKLLQDYLKTADPAEQAKIVDQLANTFVTNVVMSPLSPWPMWYEYNTTRFVGWPNKDNNYAIGSPWQDETARMVAINIHCVDKTSCGQK